MKRAIIIALSFLTSIIMVNAQKYDTMEYLRNRFIVYKDSTVSLCGLKTNDNDTILKPTYDVINYFSPEGYSHVLRDNKSGVIDTTGRVIIPCIWDGLNRTNTIEPLFLVTTDAIHPGHVYGMFYSQGRSGYLNEKNEVVIPVKYSHIGRYFNDEGITSFTKSKFVYKAWNWTISENPYKKSRWGLINKKGEIILPDDDYTYIGFQYGPYFVAFRGKRTTVIDKTGKRYTKLKYTKRTEYGKEISKLYDEWLATQKQ